MRFIVCSYWICQEMPFRLALEDDKTCFMWFMMNLKAMEDRY